MKKLLFCCFLLNAFLLSAQSQRAVVNLSIEEIGNVGRTAPSLIPIEAPSPFLAYFIIWNDEAPNLKIRFSADGNSWSDWQILVPDEHAPQLSGRKISELSYEAPTQRYFQVQAEAPASNITCHFYSPGDTPADALVPQTPDAQGRSCPCPQPANLTRAQWCPSGNCPPNPNPSPTTTTHLIVHHSAGTNVSSDWAAVVRSVWDFHVNGNGWSDIGYNWLVAPNGVIYEGRGDGVLGAHFCAQNTGTTGICVLGDFTNTVPTNAAISSLSAMLAWKACDVGADPLGAGFHPSSGLNLKYISGHRDGCNTACPGNSFYPMLPAVRQAVADRINVNCSGLPGPTTLAASLFNDMQANLEWTDNTLSETAFLLERSQNSNTQFALRATLPANTTTYQDTDLQANTDYYYRIRAVSGADTSDYSNQAFLTTQVSANDEQLTEQRVRLSPNPATAQLDLLIDNELSGNLDLRLADASGKIVLQKSLEKHSPLQSFQLDIGNLPAGNYFLQIRIAGREGVFKVIKA